MNFSQFTNKNVKEVFEELESEENGLSFKEAEKRLVKYGPNEVKSKETGLFDVFFRQFKSPFVYLLFVAAIIAFFIGEKIDSAAILLFVCINVTLGFIQEAKAEKAISLLKKYFPSHVRVFRQGEEKIIEKRLLVPGDIVFLESGDVAPADLRVIRVVNFLVNESILSGESVPASKTSEPIPKKAREIFEARNIIFSGTSVISGKAKGIVVATAKDMVLGEISVLVSKIRRVSAYEKEVAKISKNVLRVVLTTISLVFLANLLINGSKNFFDFLTFCIALVVSILPEALPLTVTTSLSEGALKLAKEKVVVKRLSALEDLGGIDVLCTDKTGTITENKLVVENIFAQNKEKCLSYGLLASSYVHEGIESSKNPFDVTLYKKASKRECQILKKVEIISEIPFDAARLRNSILVNNSEGERILVVRGAPEVVLGLSSEIEGSHRDELKRKIKEEGEAGKRILAVAFKKFRKNSYEEKDEKNLTFVGFFSFKDPLKKTARNAIKLAEELGIKIKIITGDSLEVAGQVAKEVKLIADPKKVISGKELDLLKEEEFKKACDDYSVFARISPQMKYRIVEALCAKYEVGFLGEGINDAPALRLANLAIAVKSAADVSRSASDIILLEDDLNVLVRGIQRGRAIFSNINKYLKSTLASNFGNFYSIALVSLFIDFLPMLPIQILLVNLLSDFPTIAVSSDSVDPLELKKPKLYDFQSLFFLVILLAIVSSFFDLIFFGIFRKTSPAFLQTLWFIESIATEIALIYAIRTPRFFAKAKRPSLPLLILSVLAISATVIIPYTQFGQQAFHFAAPPYYYLLIVLFLVVLYFAASESVKLFYFRRWRNNYNH